jgi:integrase
LIWWGGTATRNTKHRRALPLERLPELLQRCEADTGRPLTRLAVSLALLVFIRSSELRFARWSEFDFTRSMWTIPGERAPIEGVKRSHRGAKMGTAHLVPLSRQTLEVLEQIYRLSGRFELLLPGDHYYWRPMSENPKRTSIDDRFR